MRLCSLSTRSRTGYSPPSTQWTSASRRPAPIALGARNVPLANISPSGVKATPTALPCEPQTTSRSEPSGRQRRMSGRGAFVNHRPAGATNLVRKAAGAPVQAAVGAEAAAVHVVGHARVGEAGDQLFALVGHVVAVGIGQLPEAGGRRTIDRAVVPGDALRKHHLVGEDLALVEAAVAVGVFQQANRVRRVLRQLRPAQVHARRIADVQPAAIVEGGQHGPFDLGRSRDALDDKALGHAHGRDVGRHFGFFAADSRRRQCKYPHEQQGDQRAGRPTSIGVSRPGLGRKRASQIVLEGVGGHQSSSRAGQVARDPSWRVECQHERRIELAARSSYRHYCPDDSRLCLSGLSAAPANYWCCLLGGLLDRYCLSLETFDLAPE